MCVWLILLPATRASQPSCKQAYGCEDNLSEWYGWIHDPAGTNAVTAQSYRPFNMVAETDLRSSASPSTPSSSSRQGGESVAPRPNPLWAKATVPRLEKESEMQVVCIVTNTAPVPMDYASAASFSSDADIGHVCMFMEVIIPSDLFAYRSLLSGPPMSSTGYAYVKALERATEADGFLEYRIMQHCIADTIVDNTPGLGRKGRMSHRKWNKLVHALIGNTVTTTTTKTTKTSSTEEDDLPTSSAATSGVPPTGTKKPAAKTKPLRAAQLSGLSPGTKPKN